MITFLPLVACLLALVLAVRGATRRDRLTVTGALICLVSIVTFWSLGSRRVSQLEQELSDARERIAVLETAPLKRGFTSEARASLVRRLSLFVGPTAFVVANSSDLETTEYAREIATILKDAGWEVPASFGMSYAPILLPGQDGVPVGVTLGVSDGVPRDFGASLLQAFREAGMDVQLGPHWPGTEHPISILVGPKPIP